MKIDEQNPPTDLLLMVKRSKTNKYKDKANIPEPLIDPLNEILIQHSTAIEYQVKKGDYIQIINPFGRQCSDFLTFDKAKLEFGLVKSGNSKSLDILITNNASSGLDLELSLSIPVSDFTISNNIQSLVISPGVAENLTIKYSPTVSISDKYLIISHNSLMQQNPLSIQLIGIMDETQSIVAKIEEGWT